MPALFLFLQVVFIPCLRENVAIDVLGRDEVVFEVAEGFYAGVAFLCRLFSQSGVYFLCLFPGFGIESGTDISCMSSLEQMVFQLFGIKTDTVNESGSLVEDSVADEGDVGEIGNGVGIAA